MYIFILYKVYLRTFINHIRSTYFFCPLRIKEQECNTWFCLTFFPVFFHRLAFHYACKIVQRFGVKGSFPQIQQAACFQGKFGNKN